MSAWSRYSASEARQASPSGITWPVTVVWDRRTTWYSPATTAVTYVEMRGVGAKCHTAVPAVADAGSGEAWFDSTVQWAGAVTWKVNAAFRSGWSKFAKTVRAWAGSNLVYRYTLPSAESTAECIPGPSWGEA